MNFIGAKNHSEVKVSKIHKYSLFYSVHSYNCSSSLANAINLANKIVNKGSSDSEVIQPVCKQDRSNKKSAVAMANNKKEESNSRGLKSEIMKYETNFSSKEEFCVALKEIINDFGIEERRV